MEFCCSGFGSHWWIFSRHELWSGLALGFRRSHGSQFLAVWNFNEFCLFSFLKKELWYYIVPHNYLTSSDKVYFPLIPIKGDTAYNCYIHFPSSVQLGPLTKLYINLDSIMICVQYDLCAMYSTYFSTLLMMLDIYTVLKSLHI